MNEQNIFIVRCGEVALKGMNKPYFERMLVDRIKARLKKINNGTDIDVKRHEGLIFVRTDKSYEKDLIVKEISKEDARDAREIAKAIDKLESLYLEIKSANEAELVLKTSDKETETLKQLKDICVKQVVRMNSRY